MAIINCKNGITRSQLETAWAVGDQIDNFVGGVELPIAWLYYDVPMDFPNYLGAAGERRTWREYGLYKKSLDGNSFLIYVGERDGNGNREQPVKHAELAIWIGKFGIENILIPDEGLARLNGPDYLDPDQSNL